MKSHAVRHAAAGLLGFVLMTSLTTAVARATPPGDAGAPVATAPSREIEAQTARQIEAFTDEAPIVDEDSPWARGLYAPVAPGDGAVDALIGLGAAPAALPRQMHGEVSAAVGTHGLREGSAAVELPIGDDATLGLAISSARFGR